LNAINKAFLNSDYCFTPYTPNPQVDTAYEIYLSLYQAVSGTEEEKIIYPQFPYFFHDF